MHAKRLAPEVKPSKPQFALRTKIIASFCAFMLAASVTVTAIPTTTADANTYVMATSTVYLNVRESATTSSAVITTIDPDTKVTIIDNKDSEWVHVKLSDGRTGYCFAEYLEIDEVSIKLSLSSRDLAIGSTRGISVKSTCDKSKIVWTSSNKKIMTVDSNGIMKGVSAGKAILTATNPLTGGSATAKITVKKPDYDKVYIDNPPKEISIGSSVKIHARASKEGGKVYYNISDSSIAKISSTGVVTGLKAGKVKIRANDSTGTISKCIYINIVEPVATSVSLSPSNAKVAVDAKKTLTAKVSPVAADVTYKSSDPTTVRVVQSGEYKGMSEGTATISASNSQGEILATTKITVKYPDYSSISLTNSPTSVTVGKIFNVGAKTSTGSGNIYHRSSNISVATISADGTVKALKEGVARIYSYDDTGSVYNNFNLKVVPNSSVTLSKTSASISRGENVKLTAKVKPSGSVIWSSSNTSVATVRNGVVSGLRNGTATITAKTSAGATASCKVTVKDVYSNGRISLNQNSATVNRTRTLYLEGYASSGITWTSSDPSIATVSDGFVTTKEVGQVAITAKDSSGNKSVCVVNVLAATPLKFTYTNPNSATLNSTVTFVAITDKKRKAVKFNVTIGDKTYVVNATSKTEDGNDYIWKGTLKMTKAGTFNYTAYAYLNNKWSTCSDAKGTVFVSKVTSKSSTAIQNLRASNDLISFIAEKEGFLSHYERDQMAYDPVPTIGYGVVVYPGDIFYNSLTKNEAYAWLVKEVNEGAYTSAVNRFSKNNNIKINQYQFDALVSFSYNLGTGWTYGGWNIYDLLTSYSDLNHVNKTKLVNTFAVYHHAGGQLYWGLYYRRIDEAEMFLKGDYISDGYNNKYGFNISTCCV